MTEQETVAGLLGESSDDRGSSPTRRAVIVGSVGLLATGAALIPATGSVRADVSTEPLAVEGDEITSHDGSVDELVVDPALSVVWEGMNDDEPTLTLSITFETEAEAAITPIDGEHILDGTHGDTEIHFDEIDLFDEGWSPSTFEETERGETNETDVTVTCDWEFDDGEPVVSGSESDVFTVTVENHPSQGGVGGGPSFQVDVESDEEVN